MKDNHEPLAPGGLDRVDLGLDQWRRKLDAEDFGAQDPIQVPDLHAGQYSLLSSASAPNL
jgi:hypothetical protein